MTAMMAAALLTTGCAAFQNMSKTGQGATIGGGGGAVAGAAIGAMAGGGKGAAIGTAVGAGLGAGVGALIGRRMDKQKAELEKIEGAQVETVTDENDLMIINRSGLTIRTAVSQIRLAGRATQGVRIINLRDGDQIASVMAVPAADEVLPEAEEGAEQASEPQTGTPDDTPSGRE